MPFGRHKGELLSTIPLSYLRWLIREAAIDGWFATAIQQELDRRINGGDASHPPRQEAEPTTALTAWEPLVKRWFSQLALRRHPDRGGSHAAMLALNDAHDLLRQMLRDQTQ